MTRRALMMGSASPLALHAAVPPREPDGWYGAIDAGYHLIGDLDRYDYVPAPAINQQAGGRDG